MFKGKINIPNLIFILVNLVPVIGVLAEGWDPLRVFLFYCLETILVGLFHVVKMVIIFVMNQPRHSDFPTSRIGLFGLFLFFVVFFIFHYGIFVFVQTSMFFGISGLYKGSLLGLTNPETLKNLIGNEGMLMLAIFIAYYSLQTIREASAFSLNKTGDLAKLMFQPYGRVLVQQFALIFGGMFLAFKWGTVFIVIFVLTRIYLEVFGNFGGLLNNAVEKADALRQEEK